MRRSFAILLFSLLGASVSCGILIKPTSHAGCEALVSCTFMKGQRSASHNAPAYMVNTSTESADAANGHKKQEGFRSSRLLQLSFDFGRLIMVI